MPLHHPDVVEALADLAVRERAPWMAAREQPGGIVRSVDLGLAAAGRHELADQAGQRRGEDDRRAAEGDRDGVAVDVDVGNGELSDGGDLLCVEDQHQSGDAIRSRQ
ncbi:hypothetical protein [Streptomyces sp. NPDC058307]|uniref:hypothetical protein n=1 Tax=Streptomyces sp. NPDC058307 TaxID=3346439 RepID=UPI0036EC6B14